MLDATDMARGMSSAMKWPPLAAVLAAGNRNVYRAFRQLAPNGVGKVRRYGLVGWWVVLPIFNAYEQGAAKGVGERDAVLCQFAPTGGFPPHCAQRLFVE